MAEPDKNDVDNLAILLEMPPGDERDALLARLPDHERAEAEVLLAAGDLAWESQFTAPPPAQDPIAAMLGLVPNTAYRLDGPALMKMRKARRLTVGDLADRLTARGWQTRSRDVFNWEKDNSSIPPAVVRAIAAILATSPERLTLGAPTLQPTPATLNDPNNPNDLITDRERAAEVARRHPRFEALVARYAALVRTGLDEAAEAMAGRMLATVHRGSHPDPNQMLSSLEALVAALEDRAERSRPDPHLEPPEETR